MTCDKRKKISGGRLRRRSPPTPPGAKNYREATILPGTYDPITRTVRFVMPLGPDRQPTHDAPKH
jgi:hypothetical protein